MTGQSTLSDRIIVSSATLRFDKSYGLQRIEGNVGVVDNRYNNFNFLDFTALNYGGAWHWNITPRLYGNLSGNHNEALNTFANLTGFANSANKNLRKADTVRLDGVYEVHGAWHLIGGISHDKFTNSKPFTPDFSSQIQSAEGGIRFMLPSGSSLTYKFRRGAGTFVSRPEPIESSRYDTGFTETENDIRLNWPVSGKTSIDARAGHLQRKHDNYSERDFSGFVGNFNLNYAMTGKTRLTASWARTLNNYQTGADSSGLNTTFFQDFASSYMAIDRFSLGPTWQIDDKIALRMRYDYSMMDFLGGVTTIATSLDQRSDKIHSGMLALDWQLHKAFSLNAMLNHENRSSNLSGFGFHRSAASLTARITF
jgi:exopolysaccharide biosynthesis operon protein EpsL